MFLTGGMSLQLPHILNLKLDPRNLTDYELLSAKACLQLTDTVTMHLSHECFLITGGMPLQLPHIWNLSQQLFFIRSSVLHHKFYILYIW